MKARQKLLLPLVAIVASSAAIAYTMQPGPQKGVFFRDRWERTWFLRPSAVVVSKSVATAAKEHLGKPVIFDVSEFDTKYIPREYRDGKLLADPDSETRSSHVILALALQGETLRLSIRYTGPDTFIVGNIVMLIAFSAPRRIEFVPPHPAHEGLRGLINPQPTLKSGEAATYELALADIIERLGLSPGEHQLIATYFGDSANVRVISNPLDIETKETVEPEAPSNSK